MNICNSCGEDASLTCSRCRTVFYCAPACQSRDWSKHKSACAAAAGVGSVAVSGTASATTASRAVEQISQETPDFGLCAADCGNPAVLRCSGCLGAFYCGQECQKRAWKLHKEQCKKAAKAIASLRIEAVDDLDTTFASFKRDAEAGDAKAQCCLGVCYANGSGVAVDRAEAFKWYQRAADAGFAEAQHTLGSCYDQGLGIAVNKAEAVKWYKRAAEAGHAAAQGSLGYCYSNGSGVAVDKAEAVKWYKRAAKAGHAGALTMLQLL